MSTSVLELMDAVHGTLRGDSALSALISDGGSPTENRVYDGQVADRAAHPHLVLGEAEDKPWDTKTEDGDEIGFTVHTWSRSKTNREAQQITGLVRAALHEATITVTDHSLVLIRQEMGVVVGDTDPGLRHGIQRFKAFIQPSG